MTGPGSRPASRGRRHRRARAGRRRSCPCRFAAVTPLTQARRAPRPEAPQVALENGARLSSRSSSSANEPASYRRSSVPPGSDGQQGRCSTSSWATSADRRRPISRPRSATRPSVVRPRSRRLPRRGTSMGFAPRIEHTRRGGISHARGRLGQGERPAPAVLFNHSRARDAVASRQSSKRELVDGRRGTCSPRRLRRRRVGHGRRVRPTARDRSASVLRRCATTRPKAITSSRPDRLSADWPGAAGG